MNTETTPSSPAPEIKKIHIHPPSAARVMLPDGRFMAYKEQGVPADRARFSIIAPHSFLSSRLAGCTFWMLKTKTYCICFIVHVLCRMNASAYFCNVLLKLRNSWTKGFPVRRVWRSLVDV